MTNIRLLYRTLYEFANRPETSSQTQYIEKGNMPGATLAYLSRRCDRPCPKAFEGVIVQRRGQRMGRKPKLTEAQQDEARRRRAEGAGAQLRRR